MRKIINLDRIMFLIVFILFLITRIYLIQDVPLGLHVDEAGMAYDAWSLANFGVDRYLNSFPVYFINYGGGQSVLYGYMTMIFMKILGFSVYAIRIPGVIVSSIAFIFGYKTINEIFNSRKYSLLYTFLFTILPYFVMQSRFGLDCNLMMGISSLVIYSIHKMIKIQSVKYYVLAGLSSGLILYTYALSYVVMPLFLFITFVYLIYLKKIDFKKVLYFILPLGLVAIPLVLMIFINKFGYESIKILFMTIPKLPEFRGSEFVFTNVYANFKHVTKSVLMFDWLSYNSLEEFYTLYRISIPFVIIGVIYGFCRLILSVKEKKYNFLVIVWMFALSVFIMGLFLAGQPNTNRMNGIFYAIIILLVSGIYCLDLFISSIVKFKHISLIYILLLTIIYSYNFNAFAKYYYFEYAYDKYPQTLFTHIFEDEIEFINQLNKEANMVYIEKNFRGYVYYLLSTKTSPIIYNNEKVNDLLYRNYYFDLPENIDLNSYYLVLRSNYGFNELMKQYEFVKVEFEFYNVYLPISKADEVATKDISE